MVIIHHDGSDGCDGGASSMREMWMIVLVAMLLVALMMRVL